MFSNSFAPLQYRIDKVSWCISLYDALCISNYIILLAQYIVQWNSVHNIHAMWSIRESKCLHSARYVSSQLVVSGSYIYRPSLILIFIYSSTVVAADWCMQRYKMWPGCRVPWINRGQIWNHDPFSISLTLNHFLFIYLIFCNVELLTQNDFTRYFLEQRQNVTWGWVN
jgi:hypothetical protein